MPGSAERLRMAVALCFAVVSACTAPPPTDLVLVSYDTVRRDHLPTYGYARDTAPAMAEVAQRATVFWNAFSQHTQTGPSHTSMFTGLYPREHGTQVNGQRLTAGGSTLAEILRAHGFQTAAFVSGAPMQGVAAGLQRGFDLYDDVIPESSHRDGRATVDTAVRWLASRDRTRRAFLFVHLYDAHGPYLPRGPYAHLFTSPDPGPPLGHVQIGHIVSDRSGKQLLNLNGYIDRYDEMIRYTDDAFAALLAQLDLAHTVLVLIADHGESLGERYHQLDHGGEVWDEQIRIPLVIAAPGFAATRSDPYVETVDLLPTLLELLAVPLPNTLPGHGRSLVPLMRGASSPARQVVFSSAHCDPTRLADRNYQLDKDRQLDTVRSADWKLIAYPGIEHDYFELYDLKVDPAEKHDVAAQNRDVARSFRDRLAEWKGNAGATLPTPDIDPEVRERLRQLGYND
jgi:arylsulfatase A-like enzyme